MSIWVLRDVPAMDGRTFGCGKMFAGICGVHINGSATRSRVAAVESIGIFETVTIEATGATVRSARIEQAWLDKEVVRCGYRQSGRIVSTALLARDPCPTDADIDDAMAGNIRRRGACTRIREAIGHASRSGRRED